MQVSLRELAYVSAFAVLGAYLRLVLQQATPVEFPNYLTSQFIGTFVIGSCLAIVNNKSSKSKSLNELLMVGVGVGFCGSLTSFSSWQGQIASQVMFNDTSSGLMAYRHIQNQVVGFAVPFCALPFGKAVGSSLMLFGDTSDATKPPHVAGFCWLVLPWVMLLGACVGVGVSTGLYPGPVTLSLCFAPLGACLRFILARQFNQPHHASWFAGTLVANLLGTAIWGAMWDLLWTTKGPDAAGTYSCALLQAIQDGFCGSLTTVSSFIVEVHVLSSTTEEEAAEAAPRFTPACYATLSIVLAQLVLFVVMGSLAWPSGGDRSLNLNSCL